MFVDGCPDAVFIVSVLQGGTEGSAGSIIRLNALIKEFEPQVYMEEYLKLGLTPSALDYGFFADRYPATYLGIRLSYSSSIPYIPFMLSTLLCLKIHFRKAHPHAAEPPVDAVYGGGKYFCDLPAGQPVGFQMHHLPFRFRQAGEYLHCKQPVGCLGLQVFPAVRQELIQGQPTTCIGMDTDRRRLAFRFVLIGTKNPPVSIILVDFL